MALDLRPERFGSKAPKEEYVSGAEILSRINGGSDGYLSGAEIMARANAASYAKQANRFIVDVNKFSRAVEEDTSGENQFNAADYFEERKKQAEQLKQRAAAMTLYMDDHRDSFSEDSYERMMNILSTFDTDVDDVMSRYQPSLDSKAGMRAYEDELMAAMERNAQQKQWEKAADFAFEPGSFAANMMPLLRQKMFDEGDRGVKDNWSAEQRYRLGLMQMEDPNQAKDYAKEVNAGRDPYIAYQQQEQQKADWRAMDLNAERREIDRLKAELDDYYWNSTYDATSTNARNAFDQEVKRREKEISDREQQYNLAKREQDNAQFRSAADRSDFAAKSGYVSSGFQMPTFIEDADPDELVYEYINNQEIRSQINLQTIELAEKGYDLLEPEEVSIYNYYYATEGPEKAQQYLDNIQDTLNQRLGERGAASKDQLWKQLMAGAISGYSNAVTSPQYFFDKESDYINTSPFQYMSAAIREDLADTGKHPFFDTSLGQMGYDLVNTTANMLPSIMLSGAATAMLPGAGAAIAAIPKLGAVGNAIAANAPQIGAAVGSSVMGLSAAGGAYQQALNAGYTKEQAKRYAALSGASEVALEYLLGGISKLGGEIPQAVLSNMVSGVDNAIARAAITLGGSMASEGFEEGLQEVITPWIENLTLYADKNVDWNEVAYSTLLGALSGGLMEGPAVVSNEIRSARANNLMELAKQKVEAEMATANMTAEQIEGMKPTTSADGNARQISRNESINVDGFAEVKEGNATVKLKEGGTADYRDVSFSTDKQANQYFAVESLPAIDTAHANDLLKTIQNADVGKDTAEVVAIRESYRLGYLGATTQELRGSDAQILSTKLQDQIYNIGKEQRTANDAVRAAASTARTKATAGYKKVVIEGKLSRVTRDAAKKRKAEIAYVDRIADTFAGTAVHVYESYEKNGKRYYKDNSGKERLAPNGKYVNDEIWLDLNSGDKGEGMMLNTFAHEMYHHIEKWNKPKARELAEFVVKELGLESVDKAVAAQIEKARAAGYGEDHFKGMTPEQARNEVYMRAMSDFVADSLETMFTRGDPAKAIANLKKENKGLFDQIKAFIDEWISKVKKFYSDKTISEEGAKVAQLEKFEQLQQLFMEAMAGAGENYNASLKTEADISEEQVVQADRDLEAQYSLRTFEDGTRFVDVQAEPSVFDGMTDTQMNEYVKKLLRAKFMNKVIGIDNKMFVNGDGVNEYIHSSKKVDQPTRVMKFTAAGELDNMLDAGQALPNEADGRDGHVHPDAIDFSYFKTIFKVGDEYFEGIINIKNIKRGKLFKDVTKIKNITKDIVSSYGKNPKSNFLRDASMDIVRENPEKVNTEMNSLRNQQPTAREILAQIDTSTRNKHEANLLGKYQENLSTLAELEPRLEELNNQIAELSQDKTMVKERLAVQKEQRQVKASVNRLKGLVNAFERSDMGKRLVTEVRAKTRQEQDREKLKSYKAEQKELIQTMQAEQRVIREELTGTQSVMSIMEDEFVRLAKDLEAKKIDLKTMEEKFLLVSKQYDKDTQKWLREYRNLMSKYRKLDAKNDRNLSKIEQLEKIILQQRQTAKEKITQVRETQEIQKQRKHVEDNVKKLMRILANPTKDAHAPMALQEPLQKFLDSIDFTSNRYASGGSATIKDRSYINALAKVRDAIKGQRTALTTEDGVFTLDVPPEFTEEIDKHINMVSDATEGLDLTTNRIYEMTSSELKDLNYILNTINKAIRDIDRMHMQGERERTSGLARDTTQEMQNRKPIKGEKGNWFMWNNYTPFQAFRRYGKAALKIFDGLKAGQAKLARNIDSVVKFTEKTYTAKEVKEWEHNRHEIKLDSGKTVTMSSAQIMTFWCLSHRDQAIPHMQGAGIRMTTLEKFVSKANSQKELVQKDHFSLTLEDVNRINQLLTERQRTVAREMQQFMQNVGGKWVNEISVARWDFVTATEKDYFPIDTVETSRDVKNPDQKKTSLFALLNKSFTKAPVPNAQNAMVIDSIFNVFANHMSEVAEYNAFALPLVDTMKWFNYRENVDIGEGHINDVGVNRAIRDTLGTEAIQYFVDLMTDINSSQKAGRHEDFFGKILGRSKAASVAWNTRVAIQQISALPRASMILNYKSLIKGASKIRLKYATQEMMKYSGIALWKSMGYYDLNVGKSVERQIKGDTSVVDKFNELGMWLPGKMDERTWARIWIATKDQVQNTTNLTGEELLQATAKKFEDVVYETQVVDSVLTKSSFMRDKNLFIKEATSFMAEPTLAINILMSAFQDYEDGHSRSEKVKRGLMIGFTGYALAGVVNALLGSFTDAWRDDDEFEDYWEKYRQALFGEKFFDGNLFSELNPIEKIAFVKDILSVAKGNEPHSTYFKLMTDAVNLINSYQSIADGKGSKTAYGVVYQTLLYLSAASGVGMSNMTREVIDFWNNTIGKINPEQRILRYKPDNGEELLNAIQKGTEEDIQRVFGRFENQQQAESALQSAIRGKYVAGEMTAEEAEEMLTTNFDRDDEYEVYWILEEWNYAKENGNTDGYTKYGSLYAAIETGEYETEIARFLEHGADASTIRSQISKHYRKQYLSDETVRAEIRKKLLPVYEATGMYASEVEDKFNDWDFEAEYGMTYSNFKAEYREGNVTEAELRSAMDFYGLLNYEIEEGIRELNDEIKFFNKYGMSISEMRDAYDNGDLSKNELINALVFTGKTRTEAMEEVAERDLERKYGIGYAKLDDAYKYNDISRSQFYNAMREHGATQQEADEAIIGYDWLKKNVRKYPDLAISDAKRFVIKVSDKMEERTLTDYGVSIDAYLQYKEGAKDCPGVDADGDGSIDAYSKAKQLFAMIDKLPISDEAKDGLALITNAKSTLRKYAPWH